MRRSLYPYEYTILDMLYSLLYRPMHFHEESHEIASHIRTGKRELFVQILLVFIVPIALVHFDVISISSRILLLVSLVLALFLILWKEGWKPHMLGLERGNTRSSILPYTIFTLLGVGLIISFGHLVGQTELVRWWTHKHFLYMFLVVSLFQELAYRAYLIPALSKLTSVPIYVIGTNALLFMYLHTIFPNPLVGLPLAFVGGIGFAFMYMRYPNIVLIVMSHAVLNFFAVLYGFYVIPGITY